MSEQDPKVKLQDKDGNPIVSSVGPKRTQAEKERDRHLIEQWYIEDCLSFREISKKLNDRPNVGYRVSHQQVAYDLKKLRQKWEDESFDRLTGRREEELKKLNNLEREAWQAWRRSQGEHVKRTQKLSADRNAQGQADSQSGKMEQTTVTEELVGDPRFLTTIQQCISKRIEVLGLDAPKRIAVESGSGVTDPNTMIEKPENIDAEIELLTQEMKKLEQLMDGSDAARTNTVDKQED